MSNGIIRQRITFTGSVQGVGFRYRAKHAANSVGATGWVRNEWDGTVTMEIQGRQTQIDKVLIFINSSPYIRIDWMDTLNIEVDETESGFHSR